MQVLSNQAEDVEVQLQGLRTRLSEIRIAKKWLQESRVNASQSVSGALTAHYKWLCDQEQKTLAMGKRIKESAKG